MDIAPGSSSEHLFELQLQRIFLQQKLTTRDWERVRSLLPRSRPEVVAELLAAYPLVLTAYVGASFSSVGFLASYLLVPNSAGVPALYQLCVTFDPAILLWEGHLSNDQLRGFCRQFRPSLLEYVLSLPESKVPAKSFLWCLELYFEELDYSQPHDRLVGRLLSSLAGSERHMNAVVISRCRLLETLLSRGLWLEKPLPVMSRLFKHRAALPTTALAVFRSVNYFRLDACQRRRLSDEILQRGDLDCVVELLRWQIPALPAQLDFQCPAVLVVNFLHLSSEWLPMGEYSAEIRDQWKALTLCSEMEPGAVTTALHYHVYFADSLLLRLLRHL